MSTSTKRRPSRGSMLAHRNQLVAARVEREQAPLDPALARVIDMYAESALSDAERDRVGAFIHEAVRLGGLTGPDSVRKHCTHLAKLARYAISNGREVSVPALLTTPFIDEYVRVGMAGESDSVRAQRRTRLLALAANANPGPNSPAKTAPIAHVPVRAPYTPLEMAQIRAVARTQPSLARSRTLAGVVGFGAGAGLDGMDFRDLHRHRVDLQSLDDGIMVNVGGPRPRVVVVRRQHEDLVRYACEGLEPDELITGGQKLTRHNITGGITDRAAGYRIPDIDVSLLRATWLADLMTDAIPVSLILKAAGLQSARTLTEIMVHIDPWLDHKSLRDGAPLRGAA